MATRVPRAIRPLALIAGNVAVFVALFAVLELAVRVHRDGIHDTTATLVIGTPAPYSNLGTGRWVIYDQELGYRLNPAQGRVNARSVRHPDIAVPKPQGVFRVIVLGDSIPWDEPGFVSELATHAADRGAIEVINASVPGYTSYQEVRFFARYLADTEPDLVVWTYCLNDNHRFLHQFDPQAHMLFTREAQDSLAIRSWGDWVVSRSYVLSTLRAGLLANRPASPGTPVRFAWEARPDFNIAWKSYSWRFYEAQLRELVDLLAHTPARLAIVVVPYEPQLLARARRDERAYVLTPQQHVAALCDAYGIPCLDLYSSFEQAYDAGATLYRDGIHLNPDGHHRAMAELLRFLDEHRLLPRPGGVRHGDARAERRHHGRSITLTPRSAGRRENFHRINHFSRFRRS